MTVIVPIENDMLYVNRRLAALLARSIGDAVEVPLDFACSPIALSGSKAAYFFYELAIGLNYFSRPITGTEYEASVNLTRVKDYAEPEYLTTLEGVARTTLACGEYLIDRLRAFSPMIAFARSSAPAKTTAPHASVSTRSVTTNRGSMMISRATKRRASVTLKLECVRRPGLQLAT